MDGGGRKREWSWERAMEGECCLRVGNSEGLACGLGEDKGKIEMYGKALLWQPEALSRT